MNFKSPRAFSLIACSLVACFALASCDRGPPPGTVSPQNLTDALYAVLSADRETYTREVVDRLQFQERRLKATDHFADEKTLPLPAQMLRMSAERAHVSGVNFTYSLISLWPINTQNGPQTDSERQGLRTVSATGKGYYTEETLSGVRYFSAFYPDKAVVDACVDCHNDREDSPRRDFKLGDVMGGVVIRVPLGR
jgi:Protein of unknown function (DUF3365)